MLVNPFRLAERARFFEDNGARLRADQLREALDRQGCCTECVQINLRRRVLSKVRLLAVPICDGYRHYN